MLGEKYNLPSIVYFNQDGTLNENGDRMWEWIVLKYASRSKKTWKTPDYWKKMEPFIPTK